MKSNKREVKCIKKRTGADSVYTYWYKSCDAPFQIQVTQHQQIEMQIPNSKADVPNGIQIC